MSRPEITVLDATPDGYAECSVDSGTHHAEAVLTPEEAACLAAFLRLAARQLALFCGDVSCSTCDPS